MMDPADTEALPVSACLVAFGASVGIKIHDWQVWVSHALSMLSANGAVAAGSSGLAVAACARLGDSITGSPQAPASKGRTQCSRYSCSPSSEAATGIA